MEIGSDYIITFVKLRRSHIQLGYSIFIVIPKKIETSISCILVGCCCTRIYIIGSNWIII